MLLVEGAIGIMMTTVKSCGGWVWERRLGIFYIIFVFAMALFVYTIDHRNITNINDVNSRAAAANTQALRTQRKLTKKIVNAQVSGCRRNNIFKQRYNKAFTTIKTFIFEAEQRARISAVTSPTAVQRQQAQNAVQADESIVNALKTVPITDCVKLFAKERGDIS